MKSTPSVLQSGSDMIEIFIKHPIHYFPVLKKSKIMGYISKKKVMRFSTDQQFLDKKISEILPLLLQELDHGIFFTEIETQGVKWVPYLQWVSERLEIHKKNRQDFFRKHKPVDWISPEDIATMIENHDFPIIAFDGSGELLLENHAAQKVRDLVQLKKSSNPYLNWIKKTDIKFQNHNLKSVTGSKTHRGYKCVYHIKHFYFHQASVNLIIFLSFKKKLKS